MSTSPNATCRPCNDEYNATQTRNNDTCEGISSRRSDCRRGIRYMFHSLPRMRIGSAPHPESRLPDTHPPPGGTDHPQRMCEAVFGAFGALRNRFNIYEKQPLAQLDASQDATGHTITPNADAHRRMDGRMTAWIPPQRPSTTSDNSLFATLVQNGSFPAPNSIWEHAVSIQRMRKAHLWRHLQPHRVPL